MSDAGHQGPLGPPGPEHKVTAIHEETGTMFIPGEYRSEFEIVGYDIAEGNQWTILTILEPQYDGDGFMVLYQEALGAVPFSEMATQIREAIGYKTSRP